MRTTKKQAWQAEADRNERRARERRMIDADLATQLTGAEHENERLRMLLRDLLQIHAHERVSEFMNQFNEWRQLIARARAAIPVSALTTAAKEAGG